MVTAAISFTQGGSTSSPGVAMLGIKNVAVSCQNGNDTGVASRTWTLKSVPLGSALPVGDFATDAVFQFTPDADYCYLVRLVVTGADGSVAFDERVFGVPDAEGRLVPAFEGAGSSHNFPGNTRGWAGTDAIKMVDWMLSNAGGLPPGTEYQHVECNASNEWIATNVLTIPSDGAGTAQVQGAPDTWFQVNGPTGVGIYADNKPYLQQGDGADAGDLDFWAGAGGGSSNGAGGAGGGVWIGSNYGGEGTTIGGPGGSVYIRSKRGGRGAGDVFGDCGNIDLKCGDTLCSPMSGGNIVLKSATARPFAGTITLEGGACVAPVGSVDNHVGGEIFLLGGNCTNNGDGGGIELAGGNVAADVSVSQSCMGGYVLLEGGNVSGESGAGNDWGGNVDIIGGNAGGASGFGGDITLTPGNGGLLDGAVYIFAETNPTLYFGQTYETVDAGLRLNTSTNKMEYKHPGGAWTPLP